MKKRKTGQTQRRPSQEWSRSQAPKKQVKLAADLLSSATLETPPAESLDRLSTIPLLFDAEPTGRERQGTVAFDSWAQGDAGLREVTDGHVRRLQLRAGNIQLELVAERRNKKWEFIGRVYTGTEVAHHFVLMVGPHKLLPETGGFFHWSSENALRRVRLVSLDEIIGFEEIAW